MNLPPSKTVVLRTAASDERVTVGKVGDWLVKYRFSAPRGFAAEGGPLDMFWPIAVAEAERYRRDAGVTLTATSEGPTPRQVAEASALADRIVRASPAGAGFANVTERGTARLRHMPSRFVCSFDPAADHHALAEDAGGGVTCSDRKGERSRSVHLVRSPGPQGLAQAEAAAVAALKALPGARPYTGPRLGIALANDGKVVTLPERRLARIEHGTDDARRFDRIDVAIVNGWLVTHQVSGPLDAISSIDLDAELTFVGALAEAAAPAPAPTPGADR